MRPIVLAACFSVALLASVGCRQHSTTNPQDAAGSAAEGVEDPVRGLQLAVESRDWTRAAQLAKQAMIASPQDADVLTNAAIATANSGDRVEAAKLLVDAAKASPNAEQEGRIEIAVRALLDVGRVFDAIEFIEHVLREHPDAAAFRRMLVGFLGELDLTQDLDAHMEYLIRDRAFDLPLLLSTTETSARRFSSKNIDRLLERNPDDQRPRLAVAQEYLGQRDANSAEGVLREIIARHPQFAPAHAMLARALVAQGKTGALPDWLRDAPAETAEYAGYWEALGAAAMDSGDRPGAVRAFTEATRRAPNDSGVWAQLNGALRTWKLEREQTAPTVDDSDDFDMDAIEAGIRKRLSDLFELRERYSHFHYENDRSQTAALAIADELLQLGRNWEAEAWLAIAMTLPGDAADDVRRLREDAIKKLASDREWQSRQGHPELSFDVKRFPLPNLRLLRDPESHVSKQRELSPAFPALPIVMSEESSQRGLQFYGAIGNGVKGPLVPIYQALGCGGGVIDIDHDGKHDLVFTAAGGTIRGSDSEPGALFHNLGSSFREVSSQSGFSDRGFSHGVAIGDYNDDGFQDILVLNLGRNRLFRNNGDGTFHDATEELPQRGEGDWSTSGAILDIDQDGFNDLVIINYCDADQPIDRPCYASDGHEINCYPNRFRPAGDQFVRGTEEGRLLDVSDAWVKLSTPGRGLGVVAGRLDGHHQGIFVVNDTSINNYYLWQEDSQTHGLVDRGASSGLAVDAQSLQQGSMGIASSDFDGDGDLDFYVTGFAQEYNIFYEQTAPGLWADRTAAKEMVASTLSTVGFGTQAIDVDNDGVDELIVTNGHVGNIGPGSPPYAQPLQLFRQSRGGRYLLAEVDAWGSYFSSSHVGRALFTCDIDSDGRSDVVVTHSTEPVALLVNRSSRKYRQITFRLVGTEQTRDAIGSVIDFEVTTASGTANRRLFHLAGHGYLCSNRPELTSGTGTANKVRNVQITWPDGQVQRLGELETDAEYLIVQGENEAFMLREFEEQPR